jgi:SAM-dependent methyltransferase
MSDATSHDPKTQIAAGNRWYTDDHFAKQLGNPATRHVVENRWKIFEQALRAHVGHRPAGGSAVRILDLGCGDGINLYGLGRILQKCGWPAEVFGADYNPLRLARAERIPFVKGLHRASIMRLPYANGSFDVVLCNQVLEHVREDVAALHEMRRVLKPHGLLILGVPNEGCLLARVRNHVLQPSIARSTDHVNFYTDSMLAARLAQTGFANFELRRAGFFTPHLLLHYLLNRFSLWRKLAATLGRLFPSQCAELIALCRAG